MINHNISISITDYKKTFIPLEIKAHDYGKHILNFEIDDIMCDYAVLKFKRNDGEVISYNLEGTNFVLGGSELDKPGYVTAEISFYDENGRITTNTFEFLVSPDINTDNETESSPALSILDKLIFDVAANEKQRQENEEIRDGKIKNLEDTLDTSIKQAILDSWAEVTEP